MIDLAALARKKVAGLFSDQRTHAPAQASNVRVPRLPRAQLIASTSANVVAGELSPAIRKSLVQLLMRSRPNQFDAAFTPTPVPNTHLQREMQRRAHRKYGPQ